MIDTIRLRLYGIHDEKKDTLSRIHKAEGKDTFIVPEHNEIYYRFLKLKKKNHSARRFYNEEIREISDLTQEEFILLQNAKEVSEHYQVRQKMAFVDEKEVKHLIWKIDGRMKVGSSFNEVLYVINETGGYMDFEFSIPKYLYGHNLAEFIPQPGSERRFQYGQKLDSFSGQASILYERLQKFIDKFFVDLCGFLELDMLPNKKYVEIRRIDLCYNQHFESKEKALTFLREQMKINKERERKNSKVARTHETTLEYFPSGGNYFKIYHKGSEYSSSKGDLKKHLRLNREFIEKEINKYSKKHREIYADHRDQIWYLFDSRGRGQTFEIPDEVREKIEETVRGIESRMPYNVRFLKKEADKILRYEVSLSVPFFANKFKREIFRKNCPVHQSAFKTYKRVHNNMEKRSEKRERFSSRDRETHRIMKNFLYSSCSLVLESSTPLRRWEKMAGSDYDDLSGKYEISQSVYAHTRLANVNVGHFSEKFMKVLIKHFVGYIKQFQVQKIQPYDEILLAVKEYNKRAEKEIEMYNELNKHHIINPRTGEPYRRKNGQYLTKATQLLKQSELRKKGLKKVNVNQIAGILMHLKAGKSLSQIFKELGTPSSTKSRIKQDLRMFGIFEQSINVPEEVIVRADFFEYYFKTDGEEYRKKFYVDPKHYHYG